MEEFLGVVKLFAGTYAPMDWAFCDGALLPIHRHNDLFALIGTTYGGDGMNTFALPDLRGRAVLGAGQGSELTNYKPGDKGGKESNKLDAKQLPPHTHKSVIMVSADNAELGVATSKTSSIAAPGYTSGREFNATLGFTDKEPAIQLSDKSITTETIGAGEAIENRQPFMAMNYIICLRGIWPPRP